MPNSFFGLSSRWYYPLCWLVLVFLGLAIYGQTFGFGFVFDDAGFIVNNPYIRNFDSVHSLWKIYPQTRTLGFYSFAFNYALNQLYPQGYHIFNFIIHLLTVGLVWAFAGMLLKIAGGIPLDKRFAREFPFIIAVLFLVHPCQTQAVTYISQRFESMAAMFYLGSIYFYLCGRISSLTGHKIFLFACSLLFAILGILTKEVDATIPLMVLALEFIFFKDLKKADCAKIIIVLTGGGILFFLLFMKLVRTDLNIFFHFTPIPSESHGGDIITVKSYLLTQMHVFLTFMRLLILPIQQNVDYDYPLSKGLFDPSSTWAGLCLMGGMLFLFFKLRKEFPVIAFGLAWILITFSINLAPRANIIFEHKLYLISFGFFLVVVSGLYLLVRQRVLLAGLLVIIIALLSVLSFSRNQVWKNELSLWSDSVVKSPDKARPYNNRGSAYVQEGNFIQGLSDYDKAIAISPGYANAYYNRGVVYGIRGDFAHALSDYTKAIEIIPDYADAYNNRGEIYGRLGDYVKALSDFNKALGLNPEYGGVYYNRGIVFDKQGNFTQAIVEYNKAIGINPDYAEAYYNRGLSYSYQGNYVQAVLDTRQAERLGFKKK